MKIYLVRHGERGYGKDYDTITKIGIEQSKRIGPYFKDKKIKEVYCSENQRAIDTLKYIKPYLPKNVKINVTERVRQHNFPGEVGKDVIKEFDLKVETERQLIKRIKKFVKEIKRNHKKDNLLIVSHKEVIKTMICELLNAKLKNRIYISKLPSASISYFHFENSKIKEYLIGDLTPLIKK